MKLRRATVIAVAVLAAPLVTAGQPTTPTQPASTAHSETIRIPLVERRLLGTTRELRLEATLYRSAASGAGPVLVFNHGSTGAGRASPKTTVTYPETAAYFVARGFTVVVAMRRGRGASDGDYLERYECDGSVLSAGVERAIEDLDAIMAFVMKQPWTDPARLMLGGMSRGGFLWIVYASERQTGARGLINFAGGWTTEACNRPIGFHERTLAQAGRSAKLPMLWLYSENDRNYGPDAVRSYHSAFTRAGGTADLHVFPPIGHDGHILLPRSVSVWERAVAAFLGRVGLPLP